MGPSPMPEAEVAVDDALAAALVASQHPDLVAPLRRVAEGWDNVVLRLGDDLALRLPRRSLGAGLVAKELRWLPTLASHVRLDTPVPVREGRPDHSLGYPFPWSVVRWVEGDVALGREDGLDREELVEAMAGLLSGLRGVAVPPEAPRNPWRGVPLAARDAALRERLPGLPADVDTAEVERIWDSAMAVGPDSGPDRWIHGDLHPGNLVVRGGRLVGVVDWGDLGVGDPSCDASVAWMLLGPDERSQLRRRLGDDDASWRRARGNALAHAVAVLAHSADAPAMAAMGRRTLDAVLGDADDLL